MYVGAAGEGYDGRRGAGDDFLVPHVWLMHR